MILAEYAALYRQLFTDLLYSQQKNKMILMQETLLFIDSSSCRPVVESELPKYKTENCCYCGSVQSLYQSGSPPSSWCLQTTSWSSTCTSWARCAHNHHRPGREPVYFPWLNFGSPEYNQDLIKSRLTLYRFT